MYKCDIEVSLTKLFALSFISPRVLFWSLSLKLATIIDLRVVFPLLLGAEADLIQNCFSRNFEVSLSMQLNVFFSFKTCKLERMPSDN